jgi:hypothetical protein
MSSSIGYEDIPGNYTLPDGKYDQRDATKVITCKSIKISGYAANALPAGSNRSPGQVVYDQTGNRWLGFNGTAWVVFTTAALS